MTSAALHTRESILRGLLDQGVPREKAEAFVRGYQAVADATGTSLDAARRFVESRNPILNDLTYKATDDLTYKAAARRFHAEMSGIIRDRIGPDPSIPFPLSFVLPWSALVSDDRKYSPSKRRQPNGDEHGIMILRPEYRAAKAKARSIAKDALPAGVEPVELPLELHARVWVPDNRRHDIVNFAKCVQDAFTGVVYVDDCWLYANHWLRAGVDVDRPRAEITITPIQE